MVLSRRFEEIKESDVVQLVIENEDADLEQKNHVHI